MFQGRRGGYVLVEIACGLGLAASLLGTPLSTRRPENTRDLAANERAAITLLRQVAVAQERLATSGAVDTDDDGVGEYGYFGELSGSTALRIYDPLTQSPALGAAPLHPPLLSVELGVQAPDGGGDRVIRKEGYYFKIFLPDAQRAGQIGGIAQSASAATQKAATMRFPDPDNGEKLWACYAWPVENGTTGQRAFFINQEGLVHQTRNDGSPPSNLAYSGLSRNQMPVDIAAYSDRVEAHSVSGMAAPLGVAPARANDRNVWTPLD